MALSFPTNPTVNQLYQSGSSATYQWNGSYWAISAPAQTGLSILTASYSERVANIQAEPPTTGTGSFWYDIDTGNSYIKYDTSWVPVQSNTINATSASFAESASQAISSSRAVSASFATTASVLPIPATSIQASNTTTQTFANLQSTTITGWTDNIAINAGEWNASTGVFTSAGPGTYMVACSLQLASHTYAGANSEVSFFTTISSGGIGGGVARFFNEAANYSGLTPTMQFTCLVRFTAAGQTMRIQVYNGTGNAMSNFTANNGTAITIQEVSSTISI
jgi:hypothetical protein